MTFLLERFWSGLCHICGRPTLSRPIKSRRLRKSDSQEKGMTRYALGNVWLSQKIASWRRRFSGHNFLLFVPRSADCRHTRASQNTGGWTVVFAISYGAYCFKYNARYTLAGHTMCCRSVNSCSDDIVTFARKVRMMNWWRRATVLRATRRHCFLRIEIHLTAGWYCRARE